MKVHEKWGAWTPFTSRYSQPFSSNRRLKVKKTTFQERFPAQPPTMESLYWAKIKWRPVQIFTPKGFAFRRKNCGQTDRQTDRKIIFFFKSRNFKSRQFKLTWNLGNHSHTTFHPTRPLKIPPETKKTKTPKVQKFDAFPGFVTKLWDGPQWLTPPQNGPHWLYQWAVESSRQPLPFSI
jgi:hypothetical protein